MSKVEQGRDSPMQRERGMHGRLPPLIDSDSAEPAVEGPRAGTHRRELYDQLMFSAFVISVFLGVTRVGPITLPVWLAALPLILWRFPPRLPWARGMHPGLGLVLLTALTVPVQTLAGYPPAREDLGVYLPIACTLLALVSLSGLTVTDRVLYRGLMAGGVFLCGTIVVAFYVGCDGRATPLTFYLLKQMVSTPLGDSNYLAAFLVFLFNVALYRRSPLTVLFSVFTVMTMSRGGLLCLALSVGIWAALSFRLRRTAIATAAAAALLLAGLAGSGSVFGTIASANRAGVALYEPMLSFMNETCVTAPAPPVRTRPDGTVIRPGGRDSRMPQPEAPSSVDDRYSIWGAALSSVPDHLAIGVPRSYFRHIFPEGRWSAHSWPVELLMLFGLVGLVAYLGYLVLGLSFVIALARRAHIWNGVLLGLVVAMLWGFIEVILLTPSFDTLLALLFIIALNRFGPDERSWSALLPRVFTGWRRRLSMCHGQIGP